MGNTITALLMLSLLKVSASLYGKERGDRIIGIWDLSSGDSRMEIFKFQNVYYGKVLAAPGVLEKDGITSKKDIKNPDPALRSRDIIGITHVTGLRYADGEYVDGMIYDADSGRIGSCGVEIKENELYFTGSPGRHLAGRRAIWNRVE